MRQSSGSVIKLSGILLPVWLLSLFFASCGGPSGDAKKLMDEVNRVYAEELSKPRVVNISYEITVSEKGKHNRTLTGTYVIHQNGTEARAEMVEGRVNVSAGSPGKSSFQGSTHTRNLWAHKDGVTRVYYEPVAGDKSAKPYTAFEIKHKDMPESLGSDMRDPLASSEFHDVLLKAPFEVRNGIWEGREVRILFTRDFFNVTSRTRLSAVVYVDNESKHIVRMELDEIHSEKEGESVHLKNRFDIETNFVKSANMLKTEAALPAGVEFENLTDKVMERHAESK